MAIIQQPTLELLSPAGDSERLRAAVQFGADAVYLARQEFGMRAGVKNFTDSQLEEGIRFAHERGTRVYLACNILPRNDEIDRLPGLITHAVGAGVDAVIVSDLGTFSTVRELAPEVPVHISVQTGVTNYQTARFLHSLGAKRVILARELSLEEIAEIRAKTPPELELEAFVHGAICMSVSGRCLISNYLTGRDANRGECAQSCRWKYALMEEKRPGQYFPVEESERGTRILNAKDLCMLEHLDKLHRAGVTSFKIEGRNKTTSYVAAATAAYRAGIDAYLANPADYHPPQWAMEELRNITHREYSTGFYFGTPKAGQVYDGGDYIRSWQIAGIVTACEAGMLTVSQRGRFFRGEVLSCLSPGRAPFDVTVTELFDAGGQPIESAPHPKMVVQIPFEGNVPAGSILRRRTDE